MLSDIELQANPTKDLQVNFWALKWSGMRTWPGSSWRVPCPQRSQGSTWLGSPSSQSFALRIKHQRILRLLTNGKPYLKARLSNICLVHWSQHRQGCFRGRLPVAWDSRELKKQWHLTILVYSSLFKRLNNLSSWIWKKQWHLTIHLAILVFRLDCIRSAIYLALSRVLHLRPGLDRRHTIKKRLWVIPDVRLKHIFDKYNSGRSRVLPIKYSLFNNGGTMHCLPVHYPLTQCIGQWIVDDVSFF